MHEQTRMLLTLWAVAVLLGALGAAQPRGAAAQGAGLPRLDEVVPAPGKTVPAALPTANLVVRLAPGQNPRALARANGLVPVRPFRSDPTIWVFRAATPDRAAAAAAFLRNNRMVLDAAPDPLLRKFRRAFTPNDPLFPRDAPAVGQAGQWHLIDQHAASVAARIDSRVEGAWNRDLTGQGVNIGILDDSVETTHEDLAPNYQPAFSHDFADGDSVPDPGYAADGHGIACAGVAAGRGGNGIGVTGAAPLAGVAGLRLDFDFGWLASTEADAIKFHSFGTNTNLHVKNHSYGFNSTSAYIANTTVVNALRESEGAGTIHCWAAGNERENGIFPKSDCAKEQTVVDPSTIAVGALGHNGTFSFYSCFGACLDVVAPSNGTSGFAITTVDRSGGSGYNGIAGHLNYTDNFGGTSSASPLAAGVFALVKQAQPNLNRRFLKHLLALTSDQVDPNDASVFGGGDNVTTGSAWKTNAAGFKFNQNYGFGLIDADELTQKAAFYVGVTPLATETTNTVTVNAAIPDTGSGAVGDPNDSVISRNFTLASTTPLEELLVTLNVTHPTRGHVEAYVISPSGTQGRLMLAADDSGDNLNWTFSTNAFWGENPAGQWTLKVRDALAANGTGTWNSYSVEARMGQLRPLRALFTLSAKQGVGGDEVTGNVALNGPAPPGGATVTLAKTGASITVPASVNIAEGATDASFTVTTAVVAAEEETTVTASYNGIDVARRLVLVPWLHEFGIGPAERTGGLTVRLSIRLAKPAPPGGREVEVTSNAPLVIPSPGTLTVPEGELRLRLSIPTNPVASATPVTLSAELDGRTLNGNTSILPPALKTLIVPTAAYGGRSPQGKVTLTGPTAADTTVTLASDTPAAAGVPASVVVPAGQQSASFPITTNPVAADTPVTLTASLGAVTIEKDFTVLPAALRVVTAPLTITGGQPRSGTVYLTGVAAADITVSLASDLPGVALVPATVVVPAGAQAASFTITTTAVGGATDVTITASYNGVDRQRVVQVVP